ncbi:carboxypeptidase O isoform X1 [Misgurnus anguillicaudatus]|uniref:carboxypeptidase O isoform X1 n=1 Tax=Misgurnus anguillicaudatus TaxID=75329 RepID=UPI003CCFCF1A
MLISSVLILLLWFVMKTDALPNSSSGVEKSTLEYEYNKYHPMSEIYAWIDQIVEENTGVVTSSVFGRTFEGRNMTYLKISVNPDGKQKKAIWMDCGIHAREWIAPAVCQWFVKEILRTFKTDKKLNKMVQNLDFYVMPVLNIDGYVFSWTNKTTRLWRKSRSAPPDDCDCYGVDLNRNFNFLWGTVGVSFNCCASTYPGSAAVSETESQALTKFLSNRTDEILGYFTIHSYSQKILLPYGHPNVSAPNYNELMKVGLAAAKAMKSVHGMEYEVGNSATILYPFSGNSQDWARLMGIPFSFTFELRDKGTFAFELPEDQIQPVCEEVYVGVYHIIKYIHDKTFHNAADSGAVLCSFMMWTIVMCSYITLTTLL